MELDLDGDGVLRRNEVPEHMQAAFDQADENGDGVADAQERLILASKFRRRLLNPNGDTMQNSPAHGNR